MIDPFSVESPGNNERRMRNFEQKDIITVPELEGRAVLPLNPEINDDKENLRPKIKSTNITEKGSKDEP